MARTKASLRGHPGKKVADYQLRCARQGLARLQDALYYFKESDNQKTADRIRKAISSARGAVRICEYRTVRDDVEQLMKREQDEKFAWAESEKAPFVHIVGPDHSITVTQRQLRRAIKRAK